MNIKSPVLKLKLVLSKCLLIETATKLGLDVYQLAIKVKNLLGATNDLPAAFVNELLGDGEKGGEGEKVLLAVPCEMVSGCY